ncbi:MAG TPA: cupin domain-containing protein [Acidimicrobiia bacterium]|nr:cupin domain-containing protein [Acidimicrobiia bacterium]
MANLITFTAVDPVERGDGITSHPLTPTPLEGQPYVMGITRFPPGTAIALHSHNCVEQVTVIEGEALVELDGVARPLRPFDTTQVPAGENHRFINSGSGTMSILWVYGATHVTRTFAATGVTVDQFEPT